MEARSWLPDMGKIPRRWIGTPGTAARRVSGPGTEYEDLFFSVAEFIGKIKWKEQTLNTY